jgi:NADH:ubiquinone oxidoreductase subunit 3 (subunit A)
MKNIFKNPINLIIIITCLIIVTYFLILIVKQLTPQSVYEQKMHCLELGSDTRALGCWDMVKEKYNLK